MRIILVLALYCLAVVQSGQISAEEASDPAIDTYSGTNSADAQPETDAGVDGYVPPSDSAAPEIVPPEPVPYTFAPGPDPYAAPEAEWPTLKQHLSSNAVSYAIGALGFVWLLLLARPRARVTATPTVPASVWPSATVFDVDPAERGAILSYPLLAGSRAAFLGGLVMNLAVIALLFIGQIYDVLAYSVFSPEFQFPFSNFVTSWIGGLANQELILIIMTLGTALLLINARIVRRLDRVPVTAMATIASALAAAFFVTAAVWILLTVGREGPSLRYLYVGLAGWLFVVLLRGWWCLVYLGDEHLQLLRADNTDVLSRDALADSCGIPYITRYLTSNRRLVAVFFFLSALTLSLYVGFLVAFFSTAIQFEDQVIQLLGLIVALLILPLLLVVGNFFQKLARANAWNSIDRLTAADPRPPILFLRAFKDDQLAVPPARLGFLGRLISFGLPPHSLDTILVEEGVRFGPVVALGNPRDAFPPYGAARGYFENKDWQDAVRDLAEQSQLIVLCAEETESVAWEIDHVIAQGYLPKVLFIVPPAYGDPERNVALVRRLIGKLRERYPGLAAEAHQQTANTLALAFDDAGQPELVQSSSGSRVAYQLALRRLIRARLGEAWRPVEAGVQTALKGLVGKTSGFGAAPLVETQPPQVSAMEVGLLAAVAFLISLAFWGNVSRVIVSLLVVYALVRVVGKTSWRQAAIASVAGVGLAQSVARGILWLAPPLGLEEGFRLTEETVLALTVASALSAGGVMLGMMLVVPRVRSVRLALGVILVAGLCTGTGLLLRNGLGGEFIGMLATWVGNAARDASVYGGLAMALGLPVLPAGLAASGAPSARRLAGLELLDAETRSAWLRTLQWLAATAAVASAAALIASSFPGAIDIYSPRGAVNAASIPATVCLLAGILLGLRPRSVLWVLLSAALFLSAGVVAYLLNMPYRSGDLIAGPLVLLIGIVLARRDWLEPYALPKFIYVFGGLAVTWIMLKSLPDVLYPLP